MNPIKKILVPIDFSDYSKIALKYAGDLAKLFNASITLVYVIEPAVYPADFSMGQVTLPAFDNDMQQRSITELKRIAEENLPVDLEKKTIIKTGKPFMEIIETASEEDSDLLIISSHGHTGVEHLLFGSTAEKVVRKAPCPVLTLREPLKGFKYQG